MPGKSKFIGKPRSLADPSPPKPVIAPKRAEPVAPPPPKPQEPLPTPDNRQVKTTVRDAGAPATPVPTTDADDYKLTGADIKGMSVGSKVKPKTFADARPAARQQPLIANVKFVIQHGGKIINTEAKFQTCEKLSALYEFLEKDVFESVEKFEIRQTFPATVIPRDDSKALAAMKICGSVMLNVVVTGTATLKSL